MQTPHQQEASECQFEVCRKVQRWASNVVQQSFTDRWDQYSPLWSVEEERICSWFKPYKLICEGRVRACVCITTSRTGSLIFIDAVTQDDSSRMSSVLRCLKLGTFISYLLIDLRLKCLKKTYWPCTSPDYSDEKSMTIFAVWPSGCGENVSCSSWCSAICLASSKKIFITGCRSLVKALKHLVAHVRELDLPQAVASAPSLPVDWLCVALPVREVVEVNSCVLALLH